MDEPEELFKPDSSRGKSSDIYGVASAHALVLYSKQNHVVRMQDSNHLFVSGEQIFADPCAGTFSLLRRPAYCWQDSMHCLVGY